MRLARIAVLLALAIALAGGAPGCSPHRAGAPELVGKWHSGTTSPDGRHGTSATWTFRDDGTFSMSGYPPIEVTGRWQVVERQPGKLRLKLTDQKMKAPGMEPSTWNDVDAWGELSADGKTFTHDRNTLRRE